MINHSDENSNLNLALAQFKAFGEHLSDLTAPDGSLSHSLNNIEKISNDLTKNRNLEVSLQNFREATDKLKSTMRELEPVGHNIAEFSETIKTQPWRLIWPSTKKSPEKSPTPASSEPTITVRKSTKARPSPTRSGRR